MQHSKVRKGICAVNLKDVVLWKYNYSAAQKAFAQRPRLISALVGVLLNYADMQHIKVRNGICRKDGTSRAVNLNDALLWKYNYSTAQKAFAQRPRLISALVGECIVGITSFIVTIGNNGGKGLKIKTYLL